MSAVAIIGIQISGLCASNHPSLTGGGGPPSCNRLMLSRPPATIKSASPAMMRCAANAMACRPDEQKRLTVTPGTLTGRPARIADRRAIFCPVARSGMAQPITTSSTSPGSTPARSTACLTTWPPSTAPWVMLKAPRKALPIGVRAVETITASGIVGSWGSNWLPPLWARGHRIWHGSPPPGGGRSPRSCAAGGGDGRAPFSALHMPHLPSPHPGPPPAVRPSPFRGGWVARALLLNQLLLRQLADAGARQRGAEFKRGPHLLAANLVV